MVSELQSLVDAALVHHRLDDLLHELMGRLRDVLRAEAATIAILDEDSGEMVIRASTAAVSSDGLERLAVGEGFAGRVAAARGPIVHSELPDYVLDPAMRAPGIQALLGVPLNAGGT